MMRMAAGNPPDSFQVVSGSDLNGWIGQGALVPPTDIATDQGWGSVFFPEVLQSVSDSNGVLYGVPLDIERDNTIFYNKALIGSNPMPTTVDGIMTLATTLQPTLKAMGATPFAVSDSGGWTMASVVFESTLVAQAGASFFKSYLAGQESPDAPQIQTTLTTVGQMLDMANADAPTTGWGAAVAKVCMGQAAMLVLPDFRQGAVRIDWVRPGQDRIRPDADGKREGVRLRQRDVRAAKGRSGPGCREGRVSRRPLAVLQGQLDFDLPKGAIPARNDANIMAAGYDSISQQTFADFTASGEVLVPAYAALTSTAYQTAINTALQAFSDNTNSVYKDVPTMVTALKTNYPLIKP